jgi:hypothetical protein
LGLFTNDVHDWEGRKTSFMNGPQIKWQNFTGIPAGKNLSKDRTGIMKQSCSKVDKLIGSLLELTNPVTDPFACPLKLTAIRDKRECYKMTG